MHVEGRRIIGDPENMFNKKSTKYYATSDSRCESNEEQFKIGIVVLTIIRAQMLMPY